MSDSTISQLPAALSLSPVDLIPIDQGGVTKRAPLSMLGNGSVFIQSGKSLTVNSTLIFTGTDGTTMTFPATDAFLARTDAGQTFTGTQVFGAITVTTINGATFTSSTGTFTLANGKIFTVNNTITLTGTDGTTITLPTTSATMARTDAAQSFTGLQTFTNGITTPDQVTSTIVTGTAPFVVASTTPVTNLSIGGDAATATALLNARTIDGVSFDGTVNITVVAPATHAATNKTTPVAADEFPIYDSVSGLLNHVTFANLATAVTTSAPPTSAIFHIEAATGSSALTVTLKAGASLDFRSTTLTTGVPNTRSVPSDISMVVSSGSTLGTVSAVQSEIIIVAIDNAGTVELAVVNYSGGNNLNETTLITTTAEGGAGGADTVNVFYSTTARTNVPFRVVGSVISTQTTAGTWAQTLAVQGSGGNALILQPNLRPHFTSSQQTITSAGSLTLAHGLGAIPSLVQASLICGTGENGYTAGQELVACLGLDDIGAAAGYGVICVPDATNLNMRYGSGTPAFRGMNYTTGVIVAMTNANWKLVVKAWL